MKRIRILVLITLFCMAGANAAVRDNVAIARTGATSVARTNAAPSKNTVVEKNVSSRSATNNSRAITNRTNEKPELRVGTNSSRSATTTTRTAVNNAPVVARSGTITPSVRTVRSSVNTESKSNETFGSGYNTCRDAYFTCMDQFCAKKDETYRRCACSARLVDIKKTERALGQTAGQLDDFKGLNIDVIKKSGDEVKAMLSASAGEKASKTDKSDSAQKLAGISAVLNKTKTDSLSTAGKLDIAGDINSIWSTTDLAGGADIMNLSGETLYDAVHAQCIEFAADSCAGTSTINMVVSAYGMQIENDCTTLSNSLKSKTNAAGTAIRQTEREMNNARLENYDAHNSTSINDCIAQVRRDITSDSACGPDYIHCLDITGKYLNRDTGAPIYSPDFYQLEVQTSLAGDVLLNQANRMLIIELNRKKESASRVLDTCRDLSGDVWDEFMRQAIAEIYQGQQSRIRTVKNECIDVVNNCYDAQSKSLKDFSNVKEQLLLGARLELSEQMCREKLDACSNLYGGGDMGLSELLTTMTSITDQKIAKDCRKALEEYTLDICTSPSSDILHAYPFACRTYAPGEQRYASIPKCNNLFSNGQPIDNSTSGGGGGGGGGGTTITNGYNCPSIMKYTTCKPGYYLFYNGIYTKSPIAGNKCADCPTGWTCLGGDLPPEPNMAPQTPTNDECGGDNYVGSLYQKVVRYALQSCVRPTKSSDVIPTVVLEDVNLVMDKIKVEMTKELAKECERLNGTWVDTPWDTLKNSGIMRAGSKYKLFDPFYTETSASKKWGTCVEKQ